MNWIQLLLLVLLLSSLVLLILLLLLLLLRGRYPLSVRELLHDKKDVEECGEVEKVNDRRECLYPCVCAFEDVFNLSYLLTRD